MLHEVTRLTDIGHALHMAEQDYRETFNNATLADKCAEIRECILRLVDEANQLYVVTRQ